MLRQVHDWAVDLAKDGLAVLSTYVNNERCNLLIGLPIGNNPSLVLVVKHPSQLRVQCGYLQEYSPRCARKLQEIIGQQVIGRTDSFGIKLENVKAEYLQAFAEAYREANSPTVEEGAGEVPIPASGGMP